MFWMSGPSKVTSAEEVAKAVTLLGPGVVVLPMMGRLGESRGVLECFFSFFFFWGGSFLGGIWGS